MSSVTVRNIEIGTGRPKICTSIIGRTQEEIIAEARGLLELPIDIIEWRADWYDGLHNQSMLTDTVRFLRSVCNDRILLFTIRTQAEGGEAILTPEEYGVINEWLVQSKCVDIIDVEVFIGDKIVHNIIQCAKNAGVKVIASNHDFYGTPTKEEIIDRLLRMQNIGADIAKIAVMPQSPRDVLTLLDATCEMKEQHDVTPLVTMSMSSLGSVSRISGELFGSAITFGAGREASAPGQIEVKQLHHMLNVLHI